MAQKAIFLDRDDTLIADPGYINDPDQVELLAGVTHGLREFRKMGYKLVIISNQSGIARGIFTEQKLAEIHERLKKLLGKENAYIDKIYYCPYLANGSVKKYRKDSNMRKPKPGMLLKAAEEMGLDLKKSWMIGNAYHDVAAGIAAGCRTILVQSQAARMIRGLDDPVPDYEAVNLVEAANIVKRETSHPSAVTNAKKIEPVVKEETVTAETIEPVLDEQEVVTETVENAKAKEPLAVSQEVQTEQLKNVEAQLLVETDKTEKLLEEIRNILKSKNRQDLFHEFSVMKMIAGILQVLVLFCLLVAVLYKMSPIDRSSAAFTAIGFAIVLQLMTLTLYIMNNDSQ